MANIVITHENPAAFGLLFQSGVSVNGTVGASVESFLHEELGLPAEYIKNRIQTIFLNAKPVDDPESAHVDAGDIVALSAAMPGLLGATLRKGGYYAAMRRQISHSNAEDSENGGRPGTITLKLFNLPAKEIGPQILKRGIQVKVDQLKDFFAPRSEAFWNQCRKLLLNGETIEKEGLMKWLASAEEDLFLRVLADSPAAD